MLASLAAIQFVTNIFFGAAINKETVSLRTVIGTTVICAGTATIVFVGPQDTGDVNDVQLLLELWIETPMLIWVILNTVLFIGLEFLRRRLTIREAKEIEQAEDQGLDPVAMTAGLKSVRGVVYGSTSAILGSQSTLFMKSLSELLRGVISGGPDGRNFLGLVTGVPIILGFVVSQSFWLYHPAAMIVIRAREDTG